MKQIITILVTVSLATGSSAQSPLSFLKKGPGIKNIPEIPVSKTDTTVVEIKGELVPNLSNSIKILPLDNMPCLATTIHSNMPVVTDLGGTNYKPVPIPNRFSKPLPLKSDMGEK